MKVITEHTDIYAEQTAGIFPSGKMLLFDIETTGLKKETTRIYLIGCGFFEDDGSLTVKQWLADSPSDERIILERFTAFAAGFDYIVHFNGDRFDIPYTRYRAALYGLEFPRAGLGSLDIYKRLKNAKSLLGLERMNQKSVERFMRIKRDDTMSGGDLIPVYYEYERFKEETAEKLLLLHNSCDVRGMAQLLPALAYAGIYEGKFSFEEIKDSGSTLSLIFKLFAQVPFPVSGRKDGILLWADADTLGIELDVYEGELAAPVSDYRDYYYLPQEDMVIHKDVAQFVDRKYRQKATAKNCIIKKRGRFVRTPDPCENEYYFMPGSGRNAEHYVEVPKITHSDQNKFLQYAMDFLSII